MTPGPYVLHDGEAEAHELANGNRIELKATATTTGGSITFVDADQAPGTGPPLHVHDDVDELFYVLEGHYTFTCGEQIFEGRPGSVVFVPRGTPHRFQAGDRPGRMLLVYVPGGFEGYFQDRRADEARHGRELTAAELDAIGRRYGMRVVDPA